jgi:DNA-directed RNA polymerase specialized sigma24 family protein
MDDGALLASALEGDGTAWAALYDHYSPGLFDHAWAIARDEGLAAVAVHDAFAAAAVAGRRLPPAAPVGPWLYALVRVEAVRSTRAITEHRVAVGHRRRVAGRPTVDEERDVAWEALLALSPPDRALLDLHLRQRLDADGIGPLATAAGLRSRRAFRLLTRLRTRAVALVERALADNMGTVRHPAALALVAATPPRPVPPTLRARVLDTAARGNASARLPHLRRDGFPADTGYTAPKTGLLVGTAALVLVASVGAAAAADRASTGATPTTTTSARPTTTTTVPPTTVAPTTTTTAPTTTAPPTPGILVIGSRLVDLGPAGTSGVIDLRNEGDQPLTWTATVAVPSLVVNPASGTIPPGASAQVGLALDRASAPEGSFRHLVAIAAAEAGGGGVTVVADVEHPPAISGLGASPATLADGRCGPGRATVSAAVSDESALGAVTVSWSQAGGESGSTAMAGQGGGFTGQVGPVRGTGVLTWTVTATDSRGNTSTSPAQTIPVSGC